MTFIFHVFPRLPGLWSLNVFRAIAEKVCMITRDAANEAKSSSTFVIVVAVAAAAVVV